MGLNKVLVKCGGFATQLSLYTGETIDGDPLWSARFNATDPNAIIKTHTDFLEAGADIILTNTYQTSVEGYMEYLDLDEDQSLELIKKTVQLAIVAREKYLKELPEDKKRSLQRGLPMIFGSIGPYGAHLHDGSEYTGSYADTVSPEVLKKWHRIRIDAVLEGGADALAIETIPCQVEMEAIVDLLCDEYPDVKYWTSFQCKDGSSIAHGELFHDAVFSIWNKLKERRATENCIAMGINCLHPKLVTPLLKSLNGNLPVDQRISAVVYPNSGEVYDVRLGWTGKEDCVPLEYYVPEWIELGAKVVGGCCRTTARDVTRIKDCVTKLAECKRI